MKGHLFIEKVLEASISRSLVEPKTFFRSTRSYDLKVDLAFAMGLLNNKYYSAFKAINKVRNNYAHKHDYKITLDELNAFKFDWEDIQNKAFAVACGKSISEGASIATIFYVGKQYISSTNKKINKGACAPFSFTPFVGLSQNRGGKFFSQFT
ncbi:hypothetical protein [Serratia liquefaciens]|uniref:hypothetical protein n=1 Tax=Serratia liquefaciens TaxID=614 RepID=UPI0004AC1902|nr:hypothetical protein [Serratia liquefaciens]GAK29436.1 hypothetical protein SLIQ_22390 [Serratia liquefaciens FK01]